MNKLSFDIKNMYRASTGNKFILAVRDKVTNYLVAIPLYGGTSHKVRESTYNSYAMQTWPPFYLILMKIKDFHLVFCSIFIKD